MSVDEPLKLKSCPRCNLENSVRLRFCNKCANRKESHYGQCVGNRDRQTGNGLPAGRERAPPSDAKECKGLSTGKLGKLEEEASSESRGEE